MPDADPLLPPAPARPPVADGPFTDLADRLRAWRGDPRVGAVALLAVALAAGAFWFRSGVESAGAGAGARPGADAAGSTAGERPSAVPAVPTSAVVTTTTAPASVVVHVAGAVVRPGVVSLPATARVVDAIDAAGGAAPGADLDRLNLAAHLADGQRILVARVGDPPTSADATGIVAPSSGAASGSSTTGGTDGVAGPVNLNTATQAELEALPGIGPSLAQAIVAERDRRGGFTSVDQLRQVRGIGDKRFADLRPLVTV